jgi:hypothetical protein
VNATTAIFGTLTDYATGTAIRPATAAEWRATADLVNNGTSAGLSGAWEDQDGRSVWVDGGPECEVSDRDIAELEQEAGQAGDGAQVDLCRKAAEKDEYGNVADEDARAECIRVILDNRVNMAGE